MDLSWIDNQTKQDFKDKFDDDKDTEAIFHKNAHEFKMCFIIAKNRIFSYLKEDDIKNLSQVNRYFRSEFNTTNVFISNIFSNINKAYLEEMKEKHGVAILEKKTLIKTEKLNPKITAKETKPVFKKDEKLKPKFTAQEPKMLLKKDDKIKPKITAQEPKVISKQENKKIIPNDQNKISAENPVRKSNIRIKKVEKGQTSADFGKNNKICGNYSTKMNIKENSKQTEQKKGANIFQDNLGGKLNMLGKKDIFNQTDQSFHNIVNKGTKLQPMHLQNNDLNSTNNSFNTLYLSKKSFPEVISNKSITNIEAPLLNLPKMTESLNSIKSKSNMPEFFKVPWKDLMEINQMIEKKKVEPVQREKILNLLTKWESKISEFYYDSLWKDRNTLLEIEKQFHVILKEWSSDVLRPVRRVIGSCKKNKSEDSELLDITAESLTLYLQKIKLCCEDFAVYNTVKHVEDLDYEHFTMWSSNLKKWRSQLEPYLQDFTKYANECQQIFVQRAGKILGGLVLCLQTYLHDVTNLTVKYIVDDTQSQENRKKRLGHGFKTMKLINQYFQLCNKIGFTVVGQEEYEKAFNHMYKVLRDLKKIFMLVIEDEENDLDFIKEELSDLDFCIYDSDYEELWNEVLNEFEFDINEESTTICSELPDSNQSTLTDFKTNINFNM